MEHTIILSLQIIAGFIGGFIGAVAGGGGLILLPALLLSNTPTAMVLGTNKMLSVFTTLPSALVYIRKLKINLKFWFFPILFTGIGAFVSVLIVQFIPQGVLNYVLAFLLISSTIYTLFREKNQVNKNNKKKKYPPILKNLLCSIISCFSGILGAGAGILWINLLVSIFKIKLITAIGVARLLSFISNIIAFFCYLKYGMIDIKVGLFIGVAVMVGAYFGAHTAMHISKKILNLILMAVTVFTCINLLFLN